jgi:long-chain acyl-CoA synthetase
MNTGDICNVDADGYIYIRGRDKNMILGPSGQNIYPEEIEQVLNNLPYVAESIVVDAGDGKLKALIHPDYDSAEKQGLSRDAVNKLMDDNLAQLNTQMPAYSKVASLKIYEEEFEKTPKRSIKRYLYQGK